MKDEQQIVWLVIHGDYETSVESVHATEASAKAWVVAKVLDSLKDSLRIDLQLADNAAERREARRVYRAAVAEIAAGYTGGSQYHVYSEPVLTLSRVTSQEPGGHQP